MHPNWDTLNLLVNEFAHHWARAAVAGAWALVAERIRPESNTSETPSRSPLHCMCLLEIPTETAKTPREPQEI